MQPLDLVGNVDFAHLLHRGLIWAESSRANIIVVVLLLLVTCVHQRVCLSI
jgi:hypothetical protein